MKESKESVFPKMFPRFSPKPLEQLTWKLGTYSYVAFYVSAGDLNSGPHTYTASTLAPGAFSSTPRVRLLQRPTRVLHLLPFQSESPENRIQNLNLTQRILLDVEWILLMNGQVREGSFLKLEKQEESSRFH